MAEQDPSCINTVCDIQVRMFKYTCQSFIVFIIRISKYLYTLHFIPVYSFIICYHTLKSYIKDTRYAETLRCIKYGETSCGQVIGSVLVCVSRYNTTYGKQLYLQQNEYCACLRCIYCRFNSHMDERKLHMSLSNRAVVRGFSIM